MSAEKMEVGGQVSAGAEGERVLTTHFGATNRGGRLQVERSDLDGWEPGTPFRIVRVSRRRHILQRLTEEEAGDPRTRRQRGIYHVSRRVRGNRRLSVIWVVSRAFRGGAVVQLRLRDDAIEVREMEASVERLPNGRFRLKLETRRVVVVGGFEDRQHVERVAEQLRRRLAAQKRFTVGDTFSGIGGTHLGFHLAGFRTLWAVDWSPRAARLFRHNFPDVPYYEMDIRQFNPRDLGYPNPDGLISTFPCVDVSRIRRGIKLKEGSGIGLEGSQSGLFSETLRMLRELHPHFFFLENAPDLPRTNGGRDLELIYEEVGKLGYRHIHWTVLSSLGWSPQLRPRFYLVGFREDLPFAFPEPNKTPTRLGDILEPDKQVPASYDWTPGMVRHFLRRLDPEEHARDNAERVKAGKGVRNFKPIIADADSPYAATLTSNGWKGNETSVIIRRPSGVLRKLTQTEMARYMGFPWWYRIPSDLSWSAAHALFGNSVNPKVICAIAERIRTALIEGVVRNLLPQAAARPVVQLA